MSELFINRWERSRYTGLHQYVDLNVISAYSLRKRCEEYSLIIFEINR